MVSATQLGQRLASPCELRFVPFRVLALVFAAAQAVKHAYTCLQLRREIAVAFEHRSSLSGCCGRVVVAHGVPHKEPTDVNMQP